MTEMRSRIAVRESKGTGTADGVRKTISCVKSEKSDKGGDRDNEEEEGKTQSRTPAGGADYWAF